MAICGGAVGSALDLTIASTLCLELYQARTTFAKWGLLYYCIWNLLTDDKYQNPGDAQHALDVYHHEWTSDDVGPISGMRNILP